MDTFVKLENITKIYHMGEVEIRAADNINFSIKKGEFVVIVGPSGAGKTTVLNILGGMDTATGGTLTVDGKDITAYDSRQLPGWILPVAVGSQWTVRILQSTVRGS